MWFIIMLRLMSSAKESFAMSHQSNVHCVGIDMHHKYIYYMFSVSAQCEWLNAKMLVVAVVQKHYLCKTYPMKKEQSHWPYRFDGIYGGAHSREIRSELGRHYDCFVWWTQMDTIVLYIRWKVGIRRDVFCSGRAPFLH